jgi:hypothetical protein
MDGKPHYTLVEMDDDENELKKGHLHLPSEPKPDSNSEPSDST